MQSLKGFLPKARIINTIKLEFYVQVTQFFKIVFQLTFVQSLLNAYSCQRLPEIHYSTFLMSAACVTPARIMRTLSVHVRWHANSHAACTGVRGAVRAICWMMDCLESGCVERKKWGGEPEVWRWRQANVPKQTAFVPSAQEVDVCVCARERLRHWGREQKNVSAVV